MQLTISKPPVLVVPKPVLVHPKRARATDSDDVSARSIHLFLLYVPGDSLAVSFFSLADSLMSKLKSLFIPIMGVMWGSAIELLGAFATHGAKAFKKAAVSADEEAEDGASKSKKRKQIEAESAVDGAPSALVAELELLGRYILSSVRECCAQDNVGFMDEVSGFLLFLYCNHYTNMYVMMLLFDQVRFEKMMQAVVALVPLQRAFRDEATYLTYSEDYVSSCLSALAVAVGKDLLWKPLNHKVLLLTRDSRKAVRIAAVKVIYRLFSEVSRLIGMFSSISYINMLFIICTGGRRVPTAAA